MAVVKELGFKLGRCEVSPLGHSLVFSPETPGQDAMQVSLQPKFIDVLCYLAQHYPNVVTRGALIDAIWDGNRYVGAKALTNAIWHLRKQLSPVANGQEIIETVRKSGYRLLIAPEFNPEDVADKPDLLQQTQEQVTRLKRGYRQGLLAAAVLVLLLTGFTTWHLYHDEAHFIPTTKKQLTTATDAELFPNVSPDGRWLVYGSRGNDQSYSLYLKDLNALSDTPKRLTSVNSAEIRAVWSPDGNTLYYPSQHSTTRQCHIMQLTIESGEVTPLAPCNSFNTALDLAPDGDQLAYIWLAEGDESSGIYTLALESLGSQPQRLSCQQDCLHRDRDLAYSPDGRWMAIARRFGNISEDIFLRDLSSQQELRLTTGLEDIRGLSWHHDSERLVFSTENSGVRNGYIVDIDDKQIQPLDVEGMSYPRFIPERSELVYANYIRDHQISLLALDQSIPTTPFSLLNVEYSYRNPSYSASRQRIAYVSNQTGFNEVWSVNTQGGDIRQHTQLKRRVAYPSWSHDGSKIAFLAPDDKNEGNKIHVLNLDTGSIAILATPYLDHNRPSWGWDNETVFANTLDGITEFYLDNRPPKVLSSLNMRLGQSITADKLVFTRLDKAGLWALALEETEAPLSDEPRRSSTTSKLELLLGGDKFNEGYNWVATEKGVYYRANHSDHQLVNFWRFNTNLVTPIIKLPPTVIPRAGSMAYIADSHSLLLTQSQNSKRDVIKLQHRLLL
ncbi:winged helix-turn-helix domain-containing protein [Shewanella algidipiscicola]|uniref:Transcriptional regulator n=1 Tax=Shewanella algidipiscicola TaxID=614070 RepID=A0ABQ4P9M4_9GAMM|nr:winged helix-turn-helix domain-containing protein [Shewanella algidipiscicola]GIU44215.1 transcriptional regulator [Shewanella algidipiscicola]